MAKVPSSTTMMATSPTSRASTRRPAVRSKGLRARATSGSLRVNDGADLRGGTLRGQLVGDVFCRDATEGQRAQHGMPAVVHAVVEPDELTGGIQVRDRAPLWVQ